MVSYHSTISRLQTDLARLQKEDAGQLKKEADLQSKINRARTAAANTKTASTIKSKLLEIERATRELAGVAKKRSDVAAKVAAKSKELNRYTEMQGKEDTKARAKVAAENKKLLQERQNYERSLRSALDQSKAIEQSEVREFVSYDFFISHASEDKDAIVRTLAAELIELGASVFYDEATLRIGDSLRRSIDKGLANSRYGVVVLSEAFFRKDWPQRELDGLTALEVQGGTKRILPIWHKVSKDEVAAYSPVLADKLALNTSIKSAKEIADELFQLL